MRIAITLPEGLLDDAREALGTESASDTVIVALSEMVRRSRAEELKAALGTVRFEFDPTELRRKDRLRVEP
jgi:hypothetical protein